MRDLRARDILNPRDIRRGVITYWKDKPNILSSYFAYLLTSRDTYDPRTYLTRPILGITNPSPSNRTSTTCTTSTKTLTRREIHVHVSYRLRYQYLGVEERSEMLIMQGTRLPGVSTLVYYSMLTPFRYYGNNKQQDIVQVLTFESVYAILHRQIRALRYKNMICLGYCYYQGQGLGD